jgi:Kef-type K+ transport system membrane component KefB
LEIQLTEVLVIAAGVFAVPLSLGFVTSLRLPSVVLEIVVGILIGSVVLRLVEIDAPLRILSLFMLAFHTAAPSPT